MPPPLSENDGRRPGVEEIPNMDVILIAGLWLPHTIWVDVASDLERLGHRVVPIRLPGVDDLAAHVTIEDQLAAVVEAVDAVDRPVVVGHSAACTLAWMAADRRPHQVERVIMIGGFPAANGDRYADFFEIVAGEMHFPGWETFEGPDAADLTQEVRDEISALAVPVAEAVARGQVTLTDDARYRVPVLMVCPEFTPDDARAWIAAGEIPELERAETVTFIDIASGHWPMVTAPAHLAEIIDSAAG